MNRREEKENQNGDNRANDGIEIKNVISVTRTSQTIRSLGVKDNRRYVEVDLSSNRKT